MPSAAGGISRCRSFTATGWPGKLDATADRKAGVFRVNAIHQDVAFSKTMTAAVDHEIRDLAHWLQLDLIPPDNAGRSDQ